MSNCDIQTPVYSINALKTWNTHDGGGYQGNLLRDGKVVGTFHNDGNGGPTVVEFWLKEKGRVVGRNKEEEAVFEAYIASLPDLTWPEEWGAPAGGSNTYRPDADIVIAELVESFERLRILKRHCSKKTLFHLKEDNPEEGWRTLNIPWSAKAKKYLEDRYGDQVQEIANVTVGQVAV